MAVTSTLAVVAIDARDEARDQRREAEGLVGFMLGDLRQKLEPIGRLDALDAVGARALGYFELQDKSELSDAGAGATGEGADPAGRDREQPRRPRRRAAALPRGDGRDGRGAAPRRPTTRSACSTMPRTSSGSATSRCSAARPPSPSARCANIGGWRTGWSRPIRASPNGRWSGSTPTPTLGIVQFRAARFADAAATFQASLAAIERLVAGAPQNAAYRKSLIEALAWLADAREQEGRLGEALRQRVRQVTLLDALLARARSDTDNKRQALVAHRAARACRRRAAMSGKRMAMCATPSRWARN